MMLSTRKVHCASMDFPLLRTTGLHTFGSGKAGRQEARFTAESLAVCISVQTQDALTTKPRRIA